MAYINTMSVSGIEQIHALATIPLRHGEPRCDLWQVKDLSRSPGFVAAMPSPVFLAVWYVVDGSAEVDTAGRTITLSPGDVLVCEPGMARTIRVVSQTPLHQLIVLSHAARTLAYATESLGTLPVHTTPGDGTRVRDYLADILVEARGGGRLGMRIAEDLWRLVVHHVARSHRTQHASGRGGVSRYEQCREQIRVGCERLRSLSDIARACGMHPGSVCRLFKEHGSRSPYQELLRARMTRAAELLLTTDLTVRQVGGRVGYEDPYEFSRAFKRVMFVSPRPYRERRGRE